MTIHVCGEGLVGLVPVAPGSLNDHTPALGGGPFNVAIAAARLGADVEFQSRISTDGFGQELVGRLEAEGVTTTHLQRGDEPTTLAVTTSVRTARPPITSISRARPTVWSNHV